MQLDFPLSDKDRASILLGCFTYGTVALSGGTATITHPKIKSKSVAFLSWNGGPPGVPGITLGGACTSKTLTITTSATTNANAFYLVIF